MSESPEQASCPVGDDGATYLSILLLAGSLLLLSTPALWMFTTEWVWLSPAVVALLVPPCWWLARRRGWNDQKKHASLLGLALLCCLAAQLPEFFPTGIRLFGFGTDDLPQWLSRYDWLLQLLFWTVCVYLVSRSLPLLHGRRLRAVVMAMGFRLTSDGPTQTAPPAPPAWKKGIWIIACLQLAACVLFVCIPPQWIGQMGGMVFLTAVTLVGSVSVIFLGCRPTSGEPAQSPRPISGEPARTPPPAGKKGFRFMACLLASCVLLVCIPPQWIGRTGESEFLTLFTLVGSVSVVFLGTRLMSGGTARTTRPAGEDDSRFISCLLLTACTLLFCIPVLCMNIPWRSAFLPLAAAAPLTLVSWCLARRWGCARQEAQALFFQRTLLYALVICLWPVFQPEIELNGGGMGRVFDALDHLPLHALRLGIWGLQVALASHVYARLLWIAVTVLTRQPLEFRANCLTGCAGSMLLATAVLGGIVINTSEGC